MDQGRWNEKIFLLPLFEKEKIYEAEKGICKVDTEWESEPQALHDSVYVCATCIAFYIYISAAVSYTHLTLPTSDLV